MEEKFLELSEEKQKRIINAGLECFGRWGYKANTEEIAARAGISKGLLFYYFKNKESFYLYLCKFCEQLTREAIQQEGYGEVTDFFDLLDFGGKVKWQMLEEYPYLMDFAVQMTFSAQSEKTAEADKFVGDMLEASYAMYFKNVDFSRFKEGVDPKLIYELLLRASEGYLFEQQRMKNPIKTKEAFERFDKWKELLRSLSYKEEYL